METRRRSSLGQSESSPSRLEKPPQEKRILGKRNERRNWTSSMRITVPRTAAREYQKLDKERKSLGMKARSHYEELKTLRSAAAYISRAGGFLNVKYSIPKLRERLRGLERDRRAQRKRQGELSKRQNEIRKPIEEKYRCSSCGDLHWSISSKINRLLSGVS